MTPWLAYALGIYGLVGGALFLFLFPVETDRRGLSAFCLFWPIWALILIVEAAEEARRRIGK